MKLFTDFLLMKFQFHKSHMLVEFMVHLGNYITPETMSFNIFWTVTTVLNI